jgi:hypothetical protein
MCYSLLQLAAGGATTASLQDPGGARVAQAVALELLQLQHDLQQQLEAWQQHAQRQREAAEAARQAAGAALAAARAAAAAAAHAAAAAEAAPAAAAGEGFYQLSVR